MQKSNSLVDHYWTLIGRNNNNKEYCREVKKKSEKAAKNPVGKDKRAKKLMRLRWQQDLPLDFCMAILEHHIYMIISLSLSLSKEKKLKEKGYTYIHI